MVAETRAINNFGRACDFHAPYFTYYARQCQINREREAQNLNMARKLAQGAVEYYQAVVGVAESAMQFDDL